MLQVKRARGDSRARADERTDRDVRHLIPAPRSRQAFDVARQLRVVALQFDHALRPTLVLRRSILLPQERGGERLELSLGFRELDREITRIRRRRELRLQFDDALFEREDGSLELIRLILVLRARRHRVSGGFGSRATFRDARASPGAPRPPPTRAFARQRPRQLRRGSNRARTLFLDSRSASYFLRSADLADDFDDPASSSSALDVATFSSFDPSLGMATRRAVRTGRCRADVVLDDDVRAGPAPRNPRARAMEDASGAFDRKRDARAAFERRRARAHRDRARGRGRGRDDSGRGDGASDARARDVAAGDGDEQQSAARARASLERELASEDDASARGGFDLEELLRDAARACPPRPRVGSSAAYFDVEWTVDALRESALAMIARDGDVAHADVASALALDGDALAERLRYASLARVLGLGEEYEESCGYDGVPGSTVPMKARASPVKATAVAPPTAPEAKPPPPTKDDDWLDALLDGD